MRLVKSFEKKKRSYAPKDVLGTLVKSVKSHADKTQLKISLSSENEFIPHLKIVVEPKEIENIELSMKGPYIFDLTSRIIPIHNYLKNLNWSVYVPKGIRVERPKRSIKDAFRYSISDSRQKLKTRYYKSTLKDFQAKDKYAVEDENKKHVMKEIAGKLSVLDENRDKRVFSLKQKINGNNSRISKYMLKLHSSKAKRFLKNIVSKRKKPVKIMEHHNLERRIKELKKENDGLKRQTAKIKEDYSLKKDKLKDAAMKRALSSLKQISFKPQRKDIVVHATVLLVPKRKQEV